MSKPARLAAAIAWSAFMVAGVLEIAVFAFVDPMSLHTLDGAALDLSATAVYSLAFLLFWAATAAACLLTVVLERSAEQINAEPLSGAWRRAGCDQQALPLTSASRALASRTRICLCLTSRMPSSWNLEKVRLTVSSFRPR